MVFSISEKIESRLKLSIRRADIDAQNGRRTAVILNFADKLDPVRIEPNVTAPVKTGDVLGNCALVIYAPQPYDIDAELKRAYPQECFFNDPLFKFSQEYAALVVRYHNEIKRRDSFRVIIKKAFAPRKVFFAGTDDDAQSA